MILCAWLTSLFLSQEGGLTRSLGTRASSSQHRLYYVGMFASSSAMLKLKEDMEAPSPTVIYEQTDLSFHRPGLFRVIASQS